MKAVLKYENGWMVEIPTNNNAPMLFLEWVSGYRMGKMPISKVINGNVFKIRFAIPKTEIENCVNYINNNL
jgi:hypothetical protein